MSKSYSSTTSRTSRLLWVALCSSYWSLTSVAAPAQPVPAATVTAAPVTPAFSRQQLRDLALQYSPALQASQAQLAQSEAHIQTAQAWPNPELEWQHGDQRNRLGTSNGVGTTQSVMLTQKIDFPWLRASRRQVAEAQRDGSQAQLTYQQGELLAQVDQGWANLRRRQAEWQAAQEDLKLAEQIRQRVALRVEVGEAPRYELIKADAEWLNAQKSVASAELRIRQVKAALRGLIGTVLPAEFQLVRDDELRLNVASLAELQRDILQHNPELQRARSRVQQAEKQLTLEQQLRQPSVALRAGEEQDPEFRQRKLGVVLSLPLWDRRQGQIGEAQAEIYKARHELAQLELSLTQAAETAWQQLTLSRLQIEALQGGIVREAESALRVAESAYRFGERGILDYLDAQRVFRNARNELIVARHDERLAMIDIQRLRSAHTLPAHLALQDVRP